MYAKSIMRYSELVSHCVTLVNLTMQCYLCATLLQEARREHTSFESRCL